jgi:site-specific DNA-adenine methylase
MIGIIWLTNLENVSNVLAGATILADDYRHATENAQKDDFVYQDPPYDPLIQYF